MISCYLLRSDSQMYRGSTYIGFTTDPRRRIRQHNGLLVNGARQTKRKRPWTMVVVVHGFPNKTSGLQFEWAWQHPRRSRYVKEIYRTKRPPPGVKGKLQILHEMLNLLPWKNYPLHIHYTSEDISLLGEKCCSKKPPIHMDSVWGSLDDLPLYQSTEYKEVDTDDSSHEEEEPRGMMITEYNDDSSRNGDSSCSSSTIRTGTRRKKNNNNNNNKRRNLNGYRNECNIIYECSSKERSEDMMMMMAIEQDRYEVTEKEKQRKKKRGRSPLSSSLNNMKIGDHNDDIENVDIEGVMNGDQYVTFKGNNNFRCFLCNDVDNKSSSSSSSACVRSSESSSNSSRNKMKLFECFYCNSRMHIVCLARRFRMQLEEEAGGAAAPIIPQKGHCPSCKKTMLWPTVVENARITRKRKEVVKKKKQRKQLLESRRGRDSSSSSMIMTSSSSHDYSALPLTQLSPQPDDDADDDDDDDLQHCQKKKKKKKKKKKFNLEECIHNDMNSGSCSSSNEKEEGQEDDGQIKNSAPSSSSSSSRLMSVGRGKQLVMGSCSRQPKAAVTVEQLYDEIDSDCGRKGKKRNSKDATISTTTSSSISSTLNILGCSARYQQQQQQHESRERVDDYHPVVVAINDDDDDDDDDDEKEKGVGLVESNHGAAEEEGDENRDIDSRNSTLERQGASSGPKLQNQDDLAVEDSLASRISKRYNVVLI